MKHQVKKEISNKLSVLFKSRFQTEPESVAILPGAGSHRKYFRLIAGGISVIGAYNPDPADNHAFIYLAKHFLTCGLPVPMILASNEKEGICLLQDLGNQDLLGWMEKSRNLPDFNYKLDIYYQKALDYLLGFQIMADKHLDYGQLPTQVFDKPAMHWDLNYFKYYFLRPSGINFSEKNLQSDFDALVNFLSEEKSLGFMYRDFQARNIMLKGDELYFIDFQGGRKGPLQYDLVSLIFQVKAAIPDGFRQRFIEYYIEKLKTQVAFDIESFRWHLKGFALLRFLQVLGAYGFRGWFERKPHFLESLSLLGSNLNWLSDNMPAKLPEIEKILIEIRRKMNKHTLAGNQKLTVAINSFSYRRGIPYDQTGHGGGFVFDCRLLPNPGLMDEYRELTGKDEPVIKLFESEPVMSKFVDCVHQLIMQSVESYLTSGYENLQINFGCTGGRHRSVFCAEKMSTMLRSDERLELIIKHLELPNI